MDRYDVAVIGAGPAGSMAAKHAARAGARTALLEEHASIGSPVQCAGLLGLKAVQEAELPLGPWVLGGLRGADVYSLKARLSFKASSFKAWAVERRLFDRALALEAVEEGAELLLKSAVRSVCRRNGRSFLKAGEREIEARVVISAEGVRGLLARRAGLDPPREILSGAQVEAPFHLEDPEKVELHLGAAPGLFAWVIPSGEETARIGLCTRESAWQLLQAFLRRDIIRRRLLGSPCSLVVGGLPLGPPKATATEGFLAVGDAAGQVKPTSGGGIYPGLVCAKVAGAVAAAAALEGCCSAGRLQDYDRLWRSRIGRELEIGMRLRQLLDRMSDEETDELLRYLGSRPGLLKIIEEHGDIDRPSLLVARMVPHMGIDGIKLAKLLMHALR